ncbi:MAG: discoidin domain-containing protein [Acetobacter sp.]|uniref:galactose-binding domain-containing protein n=1 Tax=Acetobacter sp. TaxID=440 RepID=UPI0039EAB52A
MTDLGAVRSVPGDRKKPRHCKVYDCFPFFNELEILDLRFRMHYEHVDFFVIVESTTTFTGLPKPLIFAQNRERYAPFLDKVIHVVVDDTPQTQDFWVREHYQKDQIRRAVMQADPNDLLLVCDADELLRPEAIEQAALFNGFTEFDMPMYQFYMNLCATPKGWSAAYALKRHMLDDFSNLSEARFGRDFRRDLSDRGQYQTVHDAGWHFTHLGGIERLKNKYRSYSHKNDPWPKAMAWEGAFERHIATGGVVGNFKDQARFVRIDAGFPNEIRFNEDHYTKIGFVKDMTDAFAQLQDIYVQMRTEFALRVLHENKVEDMLFRLTPQHYLQMADIHPPYPHWDVNGTVPFAGTLISGGQPASQSSVSPWATGTTPEDDAKGGVDGHRDGGFGFHTQEEENPWWMVDLGGMRRIRGVRLYNRLFPAECMSRASHVRIETGPDMHGMRLVYARKDSLPFGGVDGRVLDVVFDPVQHGRFVRISLPGVATLHLDQVEVYAP